MRIPALSQWTRKRDDTYDDWSRRALKDQCDEFTWTDSTQYPIVDEDGRTLGNVTLTARALSTYGSSQTDRIDFSLSGTGTLSSGADAATDGTSLRPDEEAILMVPAMPPAMPPAMLLSDSDSTFPVNNIPRALGVLHGKLVSVMRETDEGKRRESALYQMLRGMFQERPGEGRDAQLARWQREWTQPVEQATSILYGTIDSRQSYHRRPRRR